ncbi:hypothetical protein [Brachybacterium sp. GPGPB12]|uniref:hypothetical protein n=1 Tax=Brachybacterium sp. GPGPB12 TaxID=3023517 RepID=UPI00313458DD
MSEKNTDPSATGAASTPEHAPADDAAARAEIDAELAAERASRPRASDRLAGLVLRCWAGSSAGSPPSSCRSARSSCSRTPGPASAAT